MIDLAIVLVIILGIVAGIDLFFKRIPSMFLTGIILAVALVHFTFFEQGLISMAFGSLAFIYALMLYESDFIGGIADIKVLVIIGLMITSVMNFFIFMLLVIFFGMGYKLIYRYLLDRDKKEEVAFIPAIYVAYLFLFAMGSVA